MKTERTSEGILLVDDGELDGVARVLDEQGITYERLRGGLIPDEVAPPRDLLIVTPRRVERVRRGSPADAKPGRPLRIIAVDEDSPAMRRRLRRSGLHLLIRLPAEPEVWRLLVARALYRGSERREDPRVTVGSPVRLDDEARPEAEGSTLLLDLSNRGCRLRTSEAVTVGDAIEFTIADEAATGSMVGPLTLRGHVRRLVQDTESDEHMIAVVFEAEMAENDRTRLTTLINHWASGPHSLDTETAKDAPAIPPCQLASLPDLTLDDETDPPIHAGADIRVKMAGADASADSTAAPRENDGDRRGHMRGHYSSSLVAEDEEGPFVLIGRDLSPGGMRIERHPDLGMGDTFKIALRGPGVAAPFLVDAEIVRDDGPAGFGVRFVTIDRDAAAQLEKMVACLPDVESLEDGEIAGLGAILSEIMPG